MKKIILSFVVGVALAGTSFAQNITITHDGSSTDLSGTIDDHIVAVGSTDYHVVDLLINNNSGANHDWYIIRRNIDEPAGWSNYFCWGEDGVIGNCYAASSNEYFTSSAETIPAGGSGRLSTYVSVPDGAVAHYRYYVSVDGQNYLDSVDLRINEGASIEEVVPTLSVNVAPNPATNYVKVTAEGVDQATVKMIDVLGNEIMKTSIKGSKTIDVSEFRNGIYFIIIEADGVKTISRKVLVRH